MYQVGIYRSSRLIAVFEGTPAKAWRNAYSFIRLSAYGEKAESKPVFTRGRGRVSYEHGNFRATNMAKH